PAAARLDEVAQEGPRNATESKDGVGATVADVKVAVRPEHHVLSRLEPATAGGNERVGELPRGGDARRGGRRVAPQSGRGDRAVRGAAGVGVADAGGVAADGLDVAV